MIFWRMTGLAAASPVNSVLEKDNFTLEELLDEDEIIQECRALNSRLVNYLRQKAQVEQLLHYIVEAAPEDAENKRIFKFPFIACEIFICEVDVILNALVEDEELMSKLFSFLKPDHSHNTLLAGYFSKVVICLMIRKTAALMNYIQIHKEILQQLVDLIGITSIMEVLIRLIGAHENMYPSYVDEIQWLKDIDVLEMIVDKFSSSDSPEVHANVAEVLGAIIRCAPPVLGARICSSSFMGRLFHHALDCSRPKSVLVHSLSVCISVLDPKRLVTASYSLFRSQLTQGSLVVANPETVDGMLGNLGDLLKLLDVSSAAVFIPTTYGYLKPPFGRHRLKIVEFISVLLTIGSEAAERELVERGAIKHMINMFFEYPFNNCLHHKVENVIESCLESHSTLLIEHVLQDCDIIGKILGAEKQPLLLADCSKPVAATRGSSPPRFGNFGHITRIANKISQLANSNNLIKAHLQENEEWVAWHSSVLLKRNAAENIYRWSCGRPNALQDQMRESDIEDLHRDYDVAKLVNNMNQAPTNDGIQEDASVDDNSSQDVSALTPADNQDGRSINEGDPASCSNPSGEVQVDENDKKINSRIFPQVSDPNINTDQPRSSGFEGSRTEESEDTVNSSVRDHISASSSVSLDSNPIAPPPNHDVEPDKVEPAAESIKESKDSTSSNPDALPDSSPAVNPGIKPEHEELTMNVQEVDPVLNGEFINSIKKTEGSTNSSMSDHGQLPDSNPIAASEKCEIKLDDDVVSKPDTVNPSSTDPSEELKPGSSNDPPADKDTESKGSVMAN